MAIKRLQALAASFAHRGSRIGASLVLEALEGRYLPDLPLLPGHLLRIWLATLIVACQRRGLCDQDALRVLAGIAALSARRGYAVLEIRALSARVEGLHQKGAIADAGQALGRVAELLDAACTERAGQTRKESRGSIAPPELRTCLRRLAHSEEHTTDSWRLADYATLAHAAAHRMELSTGSSRSPDTRRQSAMRTILNVAARLQASAGLEALLESLNEYAREITRAERTCIVLTSASSERLVRVASSSISPEIRAKLETVSQTVIRRVISSRTPLLLHDVFGDSELMARPSVLSLSLRSVLCVPMLRGGDLFGVMYADSTIGAGSFDSVDLEILSLFAEQAAAAIETSRLLADVQKSYSELKSAQERLLRGERLRVMGEMTSGVAHEFNNLLTAILARIQLMNLGFIAPEVREDLGLIEKAALDAAGVVRRLQGFTRSQRQAAFQHVDLAEVCADVVELLRPLWSSRRRGLKAPIAVRLRASGMAFVSGDPTELREVFTNLLKNSLDAVEGGGTVVIGVESRGGRVRVQVTDDGAGIPKDLLGKVFTPFFTTKGEKGTGLGLCLAQQIVERHGGDLTLASEVGHGTTATVEIPETAQGAMLAPASGRQEGRAQSPCEIIIVDDDPNVLSPLCSYLQRSGFNIRGVGTASDALAQSRAQEPDLVISDIAMPGMDGIELCRQLKATLPKLPVVLMSGQASAIDPAKVREAGASALLAKPFTMRQVLDLVTALAQSPGDHAK